MTVQDIRSRVEKATPGPWVVTDLVFDAEKISREDAALIACAREDLMFLLAEVDRLKGALINARAVSADRIADRDRICHDLIRERDEARAELNQVIQGGA